MGGACQRTNHRTHTTPLGMQIALFAKATNPAESSRKSVNTGPLLGLLILRKCLQAGGWAVLLKELGRSHSSSASKFLPPKLAAVDRGWNSFRSGDSAGCHAGSRCPSHLGNKHVMKSPTDLDNSTKEKPRKRCESNNFAFLEMDSAFGKE
ncbi:hypothetical protein Ddc_03246 [Ditylenchus destructor]|nr:hypothetical protein Ddc_03246 [Ditylenchus destructor]